MAAAPARVRVLASAGAILIAVGLAACSARPAPSSPPSPSSDAGSPAPQETAAAPVLIENGTAEENKPYFDLVGNAFYAANGMSDGRSIIDNLVAAGFPKQDMEVTPDRTAIDLAADSIIFSVRVKGQCLLGQVSARGYSSSVAPLLGTGGCLIGATRPIDW